VAVISFIDGIASPTLIAISRSAPFLLSGHDS
jgi:hypothetical protein